MKKCDWCAVDECTMIGPNMLPFSDEAIKLFGKDVHVDCYIAWKERYERHQGAFGILNEMSDDLLA